MPAQLPANKLLPYCSQPLNDFGSESRNGLFRYASDTANALLKEEKPAYDKLKLSVYDGVLCGGHTVARLAAKKYPRVSEQLCAKLMPCLFLDLLTRGKALFIYRITDGELDGLRQITAELTGSGFGLEKQMAAMRRACAPRSPFPIGLKRRTEELSLKLSVSLMRSAADDLRFISRFNEETFFRGLSGKAFSSQLIDLSEKPVRNGFTALYAMTFFGLEPADIFTVDRVFGFTDSGVRSKDDIRQKAAAELSSRVMRNDAGELAEMAAEMGARLLELPLPDVNVNDPASLARGCTLYAGFAQLGKAYLTALSPLEIAIVPDEIGSPHKDAKERARLMAQYDSALMLCQEILTLPTAKKPQLSALRGYKQAQKLGNEVQT